MMKLLGGKRLRGFTIIELLVVIAIIGILAAIILSSMSRSRQKANDASVKTQMHQIRTAADFYYTSNNNYGQNGAQTGLCTNAVGGSAMWGSATGNLSTIVSGISTLVGGATFMDCGTSGSQWSMATRLPGGSFWCDDYNGIARGATANGTTYTALTGATGAHLTAGSSVCN